MSKTPTTIITANSITAGKVTKFGTYVRRGSVARAVQHDGTDASCLAVRDLINQYFSENLIEEVNGSLFIESWDGVALNLGDYLVLIDGTLNELSEEDFNAAYEERAAHEND